MSDGAFNTVFSTVACRADDVDDDDDDDAIVNAEVEAVSANRIIGANFTMM